MGERGQHDARRSGRRPRSRGRTNVDERALIDISKIVEVFSGRRVADNKPITGDNVFTQAAGLR